MGIKIYNKDCMLAMKDMQDNAFELAIVDPPYNLGNRLVKGGKNGKMGSLQKLADHKVTKWDVLPKKEYFEELQRVSKKQIIWGGNYFLDYLGKTDGFIVWDKMNGTNPLADCELAWQNVKGTTRMFRWHHFSGEKNKSVNKKIHPTQKHYKLYEWLLMNYAKKGDKILDTHLGSGSSAIASHNLGYDFVGYEIDKEYFDRSIKRIEEYTNQTVLWQ